MKLLSSIRKTGTLIFSSFILAIIAIVVGILIHRSQPEAPHANANSPAEREMTTTPPIQQRAHEEALAVAERDATANAKPCDHTVLTNLDLSRPPTEAELIAAGNLGEKLSPTRSAIPKLLTQPGARKRQELDNLTFGTAIQAWNDHRYDAALQLFTEHLQSFPDSPWAAESMLHIGCHHQYTARFSESVEWFDKILATAPKDSEMYHKAWLRRSIINVDLGRLEDATAGFSEMMKNDPDPKHQSYASYWLIQIELLKKNETALRDCGQKALSQAAKILGNQAEADLLFQLTAAGPHGFTAAELHTTALKHGLTSYPVRADAALDVLPTPFIAHYKDRHYVTVESVTKNTVKLYDSRISASTEMPRTSFEKNWSGFALLLKAAPVNDGIHVAENLDDIVGGCCGQPTQPSDLGDDKGGCNKSCGLPTYSVNPINMNFKVKDTPMWWEAPVGPSVYMTLLFNSQDSLNNFTPFGEKWSFEYVSYLLITPGGQIQVKDGDGKLETFPAPVAGSSTYQSPPGDFRILKKTSLQDYTITEQDGTIYHYGIPPYDGPNYVAPPPGTIITTPPPSYMDTSVPLLLSISDRHDNIISISHNSSGAITQIAHNRCTVGVWTFVYQNVSTSSGSVSRVKRIDDPFGRSTSFSYDSNANLIGQTDMGGLNYSYTYTTKNAIDATTAVSSNPGGVLVPQLLVASITTPTGTTSILTEPADGIDTRSVTYTTAEINAGYVAYGNSYPPTGRPMWTNYRITIKDHLQSPTEYYFCGYNSKRYIRDPIQMQRANGLVRPEQGARLEMRSTLVGGKGAISETNLYDEDGSTCVYQTTSTSYNANTRLASYISNGNGGSHYLEYNSQGKPYLIKLNNLSSEDHTINIDYKQPLGIDLDTVKRKIKNSDGSFTLKTLEDYSYYANRDLKSVTDVTGRVINYVWYSNGLPQYIADSATGDIVEFLYDTNLRPASIKVNSQTVLTTAYDTKGNLLASTDAAGRLMEYSYDDLNRLTREVRPDNSFTAYQWACCFIESVRSGKMVGNNEKTLRRSITTHDARALPKATTESDGSTTSYTFDIAGRFTKLTDPKGRVTQWEYNGAGQLTKKIYPGGSFVEFSYVTSSYGMGKISTFKNRRNTPTNNTTITYSYEYDGQPDTVSKPYPERCLTYDYDSWRRPKSITLNAGAGLPAEVHTFEYDLLDRVTSIDGPWADDTIGYIYNDAARKVTRTSPGGMTQTTIADTYGRISSIANSLGTFTNTYDGVGGPLSQITHTGANAGFNTTFTYLGDTFNRALATLTSSAPGGVTVAKHSYTYDSLGNIATWKRQAQLANPTGGTSQYLSTIYYDQADQLSSLINQPLAGSAVANSGYHYTYDPAGNIASKQVETSASGATMTTYSHNNLNQLTHLGGAGGVMPVIVRGSTSEPATVKVKPSIASVWKNARMLEGNRFEANLDLATGQNLLNIQAKDGSNNTSSYTYSLNLAAATAASPTYDSDGNMTSDGVRIYEWDFLSRLTKITWAAGSNKTTEYRYNSLGQRSEQIEKSGTAEDGHYYYLYEGSHLLCRYSGGTNTSNIDRKYLSQGEQRKENTTWIKRYYTRDHLGSIREVMNGDGSLAVRYDYDPYGKRITQYQASGYTGGCDLGFTCHITQQSPVSGQGEIVLTMFRAYDPELGRWLSADPLGESGGINLYEYVGNDPINYTDLFGLFEIYSHSEGAVGHVGCSSKGGSGKISWDFGRYAGKNPGWFNSLNPLGGGPNILRRTLGDSYVVKHKSYQVIEIPVSPSLEQEIENLFQNEFNSGKITTPSGTKLGDNERYMGSDWEPVNKNCNKHTFDSLENTLKKNGSSEALAALQKLMGFSGMSPSEVNNKMDFYNKLKKISK